MTMLLPALEETFRTGLLDVEDQPGSNDRTNCNNSGNPDSQNLTRQQSNPSQYAYLSSSEITFPFPLKKSFSEDHISDYEAQHAPIISCNEIQNISTCNDRQVEVSFSLEIIPESFNSSSPNNNQCTQLSESSNAGHQIMRNCSEREVQNVANERPAVTQNELDLLISSEENISGSINADKHPDFASEITTSQTAISMIDNLTATAQMKTIGSAQTQTETNSNMTEGQTDNSETSKDLQNSKTNRTETSVIELMGISNENDGGTEIQTGGSNKSGAENIQGNSQSEKVQTEILPLGNCIISAEIQSSNSEEELLTTINSQNNNLELSNRCNTTLSNSIQNPSSSASRKRPSLNDSSETVICKKGNYRIEIRNNELELNSQLNLSTEDENTSAASNENENLNNVNVEVVPFHDNHYVRLSRGNDFRQNRKEKTNTKNDAQQEPLNQIPTISEKKYSCHKCDKHFSFLFGLTKHNQKNHFNDENAKDVESENVHFDDENIELENVNFDKGVVVNNEDDKIGSEMQSSSKDTRSKRVKTNEGEKSKSEKSTKLRCSICGVAFSQYNNLIVHMGRFHYHERLKKLFGENSLECLLCSKKFNGESGLLYHLVVKHNALAGVIPSKDQVPINTNAKSSKSRGAAKARRVAKISLREIPQKVSSNKNESTSNKNESTSNKNESTSNKNESTSNKNIYTSNKNESTSYDDNPADVMFQCHVCPSKYNIYKKLLRHMAARHFREKIREFYGSVEWECKLCDKLLFDENCLIRHLAITHNVLEEIIPPKSLLVVRPEESQDDSAELDNSLFATPKMLSSKSSKTNKSSKENILENNDEDICPEEIKPSRRYSKSQSRRKLKPNVECHFCQLTCCDYSSMMAHVAVKHFSDKMKEFRTDNHLECKFCKNVFSNERSLWRHLATAHNVLESVMPPKNETINNDDDDKDDEENENKSKLKLIDCHLCQELFETQSTFVSHLAVVHFGSQLLEDNDDSTNRCSKCYHYFEKQDNLLIHLAKNHNSLDKFVSDL
jgi:hypothetical protein